MLAGSGLAFGSFAMGAPAAFADNEAEAQNVEQVDDEGQGTSSPRPETVGNSSSAPPDEDTPNSDDEESEEGNRAGESEPNLRAFSEGGATG